MILKAEYIWLDSSTGSIIIRSKTRIINTTSDKLDDFPVWDEMIGIDDSSVKCLLKPLRIYKDKSRCEKSYIVLCGIFTMDGKPHENNHRFGLDSLALNNEIRFGFEQEYILLDVNTGRPVGYPQSSFNEPVNRNDNYCGVGPHRVSHRSLVEEHLDACINTGIGIIGVNAELTMGQWEYQINHEGTPENSCDDLIVSRYLLERISEKYNVMVCYNTRVKEYHLPFCHINFSTKQMENGVDSEIVKNLSLILNHDNLKHLEAFGGDMDRFNGSKYVPSINNCDIGVNDKTTSINFVKDKNYFEDRRPPATVDPYKACKILSQSINKLFK